MKTIPKVTNLDAAVTAPPSKSYSVRALLLAAMAEGTTTVTNCLDSDDTRYALEALRTIGFEVRGTLREGVQIGARKSISANEVPVFAGNAGTAMRFLTGWLSFVPGRFLLHGEQRMHQRPIGDLVDVLLSIGAEVEYVDPWVPSAPIGDTEMKSVELTAQSIASYDCVLVATDHAKFDYDLVKAHAKLIVDSRGKYLDPAPNIVKA